MKKFTLSLLSMALMVVAAFAQPCTINQNNTEFFDPKVDAVPCATRGVPYDETLQLYIPAQVDLKDYIPSLPINYILYCDSVVLNDITGLPSGLSWSSNPNQKTFLGGTNACGRTFGTTNDPTGVYQISFNGLMYFRGNPITNIFDGDTTVAISDFLQANQGTPTYPLQVINQGETCGVVGIKDFNSALNSIIRVYPNPSTGTFHFELNTGSRIKGDIVVLDVAGKQVYSHSLDVTGWYSHQINLNGLAKGLYTVQLRTAEGFAAKTVTIE